MGFIRDIFCSHHLLKNWRTLIEHVDVRCVWNDLCHDGFLVVDDRDREDPKDEVVVCLLLTFATHRLGRRLEGEGHWVSGEGGEAAIRQGPDVDEVEDAAPQLMRDLQHEGAQVLLLKSRPVVEDHLEDNVLGGRSVLRMDALVARARRVTHQVRLVINGLGMAALDTLHFVDNEVVLDWKRNPFYKTKFFRW